MLKEKKKSSGNRKWFWVGACIHSLGTGSFWGSSVLRSQGAESNLILLSSGLLSIAVFSESFYLCTPGIDTTHRLLSQGSGSRSSAELNQPSRRALSSVKKLYIEVLFFFPPKLVFVSVYKWNFKCVPPPWHFLWAF